MNKEQTNTYDAIVIGSGISGGWAAKELAEKGLKTLVLERGRSVKHNEDYPTTNLSPWEFPHRGDMTLNIIKDNPVLARCNAFKEDSAHFFVKDKEHPYIQTKPFDWIRGYQVGGKSLTWARHTQRWSDFDFTGPARDGFAVDWPIRYSDIAPWYSHVEKFVGISGNKDGLPNLPDGEFLPPMEMNCVEKFFQQKVRDAYSDRHVIMARCAHITKAAPIHIQQGRVDCQYRNLCRRGCPFGGYFSSNSSTLPWAEKTGNMTLIPDSIVHSVIYDDEKQKATGVLVIDAKTNKEVIYYAKIIFVNAAAINTNIILLNSKSKRFPDGLGNDNGLLGKYFAFHNYRGRVTAECEDFAEFTTEGRRPTSAYIPRFRNVHHQETDFLRGYAVSFGARRAQVKPRGIGEDLKSQLENPKEGNWLVSAGFMGETIPKETNSLSLSPLEKDQWGVPVPVINVSYDDNDEKMITDFHEQMTAMFAKAGFTNIQTKDTKQAPGLDIHEMGGVRMGHDPGTSLLNGFNQLHHCKNVFVTDGACMTSTGTQNPSLTYMALTARAADYAVKELKRNNL